MPPGPAFRYLYEHQHAKSMPQSCKRMGTFPMACAQSKPTMQPCTCPASQRLGTYSESWTGAAHLGSSGPGDRLHVEPLSRIVLHCSEADHRNRVAFFFDEAQDVFGPDVVLAVPRIDGQERGGWVVVQCDMRGERVLQNTGERSPAEEFRGRPEEATHGIRGEGFAFVHDLVPLRCWLVERGEQSMQVPRQGSHASDFRRFGACARSGSGVSAWFPASQAHVKARKAVPTISARKGVTFSSILTQGRLYSWSIWPRTALKGGNR